MTSLKITAKGQLTLKKDLLHHLGVRPGERITAEKLPDGRIEVKAAVSGAKISDTFNFLKKETKEHLSIEEMGRIVSRGWTGAR